MGNHTDELSKAPLVTTLLSARGNVSPEAKYFVSEWYRSEGIDKQYLYPTFARMEVTDIDVSDVPDQPGKKQGRIVYELDVQVGM
jgi:hypothetical protein